MQANNLDESVGIDVAESKLHSLLIGESGSPICKLMRDDLCRRLSVLDSFL